MQKGFTLIEVIVAVTILIIITSIGAIAYNEVIQSSRDSQRKSDLTKLSQAVELFKTRNGHYPVTGVNVWYSSEPGDVRGNNGGDWIPGLVASGLASELPRDPLGGVTDNAICLGINPNWRRAYLYRSETGASYKIISHCAAENPTWDRIVTTDWSHDDPFFDPIRPAHAWAIYSDAVSRNY